MLVARRSCCSNSMHRLRASIKSSLRAGTDQVVSLAAVVEGSQARLAENCVGDYTETWESAQLFQDDSEVVLEGWSSNLSPYPCEEEEKELEVRKHSNSSATSSNGSHTHGVKIQGRADHHRHSLHANGVTSAACNTNQPLLGKLSTHDSTLMRLSDATLADTSGQTVGRLKSLLMTLEDTACSSVPWMVQGNPKKKRQTKQGHCRQKQSHAGSQNGNQGQQSVYQMSDCRLTTSIAAATSSHTLFDLFTEHRDRMNITHTSVMMKCLSRHMSAAASIGTSYSLVEEQLSKQHSPSKFLKSSKQMTLAKEAQLLSWLQDKALFTLHEAQMSQIADILSAVHLVAVAQERSHKGGWVRSSLMSESGWRMQHKAKAYDWQEAPPESGMYDSLMNSDPAMLSSMSSMSEEFEGDYDAAVIDMESTTDSSGGMAAILNARVLHSSRILKRESKDLVKAALLHSVKIMVSAASPLSDLIRLVSAVGRLGFAPGPEWQATFFEATLPSLRRLSKPDLIRLASALPRLQPSTQPPDTWISEFYSRSQQLLSVLDARELTCLLVCVSRMPRPHPTVWLDSALQRCTDCLDGFDAPAYALLLHSLGRMRHRPPRSWVQELIESSMGIFDDFTPEELSLVLRGCVMLRARPGVDWLIEFYATSQRQMSEGLCSGPQLANIGWALALLKLRPPKQWMHVWVTELKRQLRNTHRPPCVSSDLWHGIGYAVHAKRATVAMEAFRVPDLDLWCRWLRTPMPRRTKGLESVIKKRLRRVAAKDLETSEESWEGEAISVIRDQ